MLFRAIFKVLGQYLFGFTLILMIPLALAVYYQFIANPADHPQPHSTIAFLITVFISGSLGSICSLLGRDDTGHLYKKEGIALVALIWLLTPAIAALPFIFSGTIHNPVQAYFEAASGLTTTGATVLQAKAYDPVTGNEIPITVSYRDPKPISYTFYGTVAPVKNPETKKELYTGIEAVSKAVLFWRSFTQWIGGVGIVVLFVAILPSLGVSGKLIARSEMPGPLKDSWTPRIKQAAIQLWLIYLALTVFQIIALMSTNAKMEWLDAVTVTFSTLSTGGFSVHNASIGYYQNAYTDWVVIIFMILGGVNFALYYYVVRGRFYRLYTPEFILYVIIILLSSALATWYLFNVSTPLLTGGTEVLSTIAESTRYASFQVISALTSTGFATADYDSWPYVVQVLMLILMFVGGMSGSTAGGIKIIRQYILFRIAHQKVESLYRTGTIQQFRVYDQEINNDTSLNVLCFFLFIVTISAIGTFLFVVDDIDPETSLGLVACMINNCGLAFRVGGPTESCAFLSNFSLILSSILMLLGRLEFFVLLAILTPSFWKKTS